QFFTIIYLWFVLMNKIERLANASKHTQRKHVDFHQPQCVNVILIPFNKIAVFHGCRTNRNCLVQPVLRQHETADMLRKMSRKSDQHMSKFHRAVNKRIIRIEPRLSDMLLVDAATGKTPDCICQRGCYIFCKSKRLADITHSAARSIADDGCNNGSAIR